MARRKRTRPGSAYDRGVRVQTTIAPLTSKMIDALLATGLFGLNRALVVQELIYRSLRDPAVMAFYRASVPDKPIREPGPRRRG